MSTTTARQEGTEQLLSLPLQFVTYSPEATPQASRELKATVRAHVTRRRHHQRRQTDPFRHANTTPPPRPSAKSGPQPRSNTLIKRVSKQSARKSSQEDVAPASSSTSAGCGSRTPSLSPPLGSTQEDPFWTFPVDYSPFFPPIIAHYIQNLALPVEVLDGPTETGLLRTHWFPMAMMSPATMYAILLMAGSHYYHAWSSKSHAIEEGEATEPVIPPQVILTLKARALDEVNKCLSSNDIRVAVGDSTIGAVAKLAAFEAVFGDVQAYQQHMTGLRRMLQVRRTLGSALGPLDEFLRRLVAWIEINAAHFTGLAGGESGLGLGIDIEEPQPLIFAGTTQTRAEIQSLAKSEAS